MVLPIFYPYIPKAVQIKIPKETLSFQKISPILWDYPKDPLFPDQSNLHNVGQYNGIPGEDINASKTLFSDKISGKGVVLMLHDDGILTTHNDLKHAINKDFIINPYDYSKNIDDHSSHGTGCAGIIAGKWDNGLCGAGVAPDITLGGTKTISYETSKQVIIDSFSYRSDMVDIHSIAFEMSHCFDDYCYADQQDRDMNSFIHRLTTNSRNGKGSVFVFAAGNEATILGDTNFQSMSNWRDNIVVASSTNKGQHAYYSTVSSTVTINSPSAFDSTNYGTVDNSSLQFVYTTGSGSNNDCNKEFSGTSASTPLIAGIVALLLEVNNNLKQRDISMILSLTATKNDPKHPSWFKNGAGLYYSPYFGFGRVDVDRAIDLAKNWENIESEIQKTFINQSIFHIEAKCKSEVKVDINVDEKMYIETVELSFDIETDSYSTTRIAVESPSGAQSVVKQVTPIKEPYVRRLTKYIVIRGFLGEETNGTWRVRFINYGCYKSSRIRNVALTFYGTNKQYTQICKQSIGQEPYKYQHLSQSKSPEIIMAENNIDVYGQIYLKFESDDSYRCNTYIEDTEKSSRIYMGTFKSPARKQIVIPFNFPAVPDNFKGNLVIESPTSGWSAKFNINVANKETKKQIVAGWIDKKGGGVRIELPLSKNIPTETPGNIIIVIADEGENKPKRWWKVNNIGYVQINEKFPNETTKFTVISSTCNNVDDLDCFVYQTSEIGDTIVHQVEDRVKKHNHELEIIITVSLGVAIIISIVIAIIAYKVIKNKPKSGSCLNEDMIRNELV